MATATPGLTCGTISGEQGDQVGMVKEVLFTTKKYWRGRKCDLLGDEPGGELRRHGEVLQGGLHWQLGGRGVAGEKGAGE